MPSTEGLANSRALVGPLALSAGVAAAGGYTDGVGSWARATCPVPPSTTAHTLQRIKKDNLIRKKKRPGYYGQFLPLRETNGCGYSAAQVSDC